jgi:DNA-binding transcriptional ArsR family regulator
MTALVKALSHPARGQIVRALGDGPASAMQLAREMGSGNAHVAYHVQVLHEIGCVQLAEADSPVEHLYELSADALLIEREADT